MIRRSILISILLLSFGLSIYGQKEKVKNLPYVDMRMFHLGFHLGFHSQDMLITNNGQRIGGETWFAEIPSYSPGFSVGVIGEMFLNSYMSLRFSPTINFGDKKFIFKESTTEEDFTTNVRSNYLSFPLDLKITSLRLNNYRPYFIAGVYGSYDLGRKKGNPLLLKSQDYGIAFGIGCDLYLPYFKLCPELKFCFGLTNLLETNRSDLSDTSVQKYAQSLSKLTSRMVVFTFNFE